MLYWTADAQVLMVLVHEYHQANPMECYTGTLGLFQMLSCSTTLPLSVLE